MREIKFRGRSKLNAKWAYGSLVQRGDDWCSIIVNSPEYGDLNNNEVRVITETVGQYTGLKDKNSKEIYEGDIIELVNADYEKIKVICEYGLVRRHMMGAKLIEVDIPTFYFKLPNGNKTFPIVSNYLGKHDLDIFEVIGNIYDTQTLNKCE